MNLQAFLDRKDAEPETLRKLLRYEPDIGKLFWLPRDASWFCDGNVGADGVAASWNARRAGAVAFTADNGWGYFQGRVFRKSYLAHRVIWAIVHGAWPDDTIDHINGDRKDNRLSNLRAATRAQNNRNTRLKSQTKSGVKGVTPTREGRWQARILVDGKTINLGIHNSIDDAAAAYAAASAEFHGEFGRVA